MLGFSIPTGSPPQSLRRKDSSYVKRIALHIGSTGWSTGNADLPPAQHIMGLAGPFDLERTVGLTEWGGLGGAATLTVGEIELNNQGGAVDDWPTRYGVDGRKMKLRVGTIKPDANGKPQVVPTSAFQMIAEARTAGWQWSPSGLRIKMQDGTAELDRPVQSEVYTGTGGAEGGDDLAGVTKPLVWGSCFNIPMVLLDQALQLWQGQNGPMLAYDALYDGGLNLVNAGDVDSYDKLIAAEVDPGAFLTCLKRGMLRTGTAPVSTLTADVRGDGFAQEAVGRRPWSNGRYWSGGYAWKASGDVRVYVDTAALIIYRLLTVHLGYGWSQIDYGQFQTVNVQQPAPVGFMLRAGEQTTAREAIERLAGSIGAYTGVLPSGEFTIARIEPPSARSPDRIDASNIVNLEAVDLPWITPWAEYSIAYRRNWNPMNANEILGDERSISANRRAFLTSAYRTVTLLDSRHRAKFPSAATSFDTSGFWVTDGAAKAEAARRSALYRNARMYLATVKGRLLRTGIVSTIMVDHPRVDGAPRPMTMIGNATNTGARTSELRLFG